MKEDNAKIDAILEELNNISGKSVWKANEGFNTLLALDAAPNGGFDLNMNRGTTVKVFVNTKTGEVKTYLAGAVT